MNYCLESNLGTVQDSTLTSSLTVDLDRQNSDPCPVDFEYSLLFGDTAGLTCALSNVLQVTNQIQSFLTSRPPRIGRLTVQAKARKRIFGHTVDLR